MSGQPLVFMVIKFTILLNGKPGHLLVCQGIAPLILNQLSASENRTRFYYRKIDNLEEIFYIMEYIQNLFDFSMKIHPTVQ